MSHESWLVYSQISNVYYKSIRALVLVVLKSYIAIFNTTKYKNMPTLVEAKPNNLVSQSQIIWLHNYSAQPKIFGYAL